MNSVHPLDWPGSFEGFDHSEGRGYEKEFISVFYVVVDATARLQEALSRDVTELFAAVNQKPIEIVSDVPGIFRSCGYSRRGRKRQSLLNLPGYWTAMYSELGLGVHDLLTKRNW